MPAVSIIPQAAGAAPDPEAALESLVRRMALRDETALARFYEVTSRRAYGLALRITRRAEAAEEVLEDAYLQAWREAARFDPRRGRPLTWLLTICRSRALDHLRRQDPADLHPDPDELRREVRADGADPLNLLLALETGSAVRAAVERLEPATRQLIALAFFRGLTHQEIADVCRMPLGTVKATLTRAYRKMRPHLEPNAPESQP
ncbi:MAG: sigma-70 family RNA polymerase sigma factor [Betaproteobacteria bacterium]|nr:sigma-70 family RNA polymerase sigma factor [Betaproteobacteria bacterium]